MGEVKGIQELKEYYSQDEVVSEYHEERFSRFDGKLLDILEKEIIISLFKDTEDYDSILEIPVGTGRITSVIIKIFGKNKVIGVDTSTKMLKTTRKNLGNFPLILFSITKTPLKKKFDVIFSFRLLRHLKKDERVLAYKELRKMLSKDGILVFDVANSFWNKYHPQRKIYDEYYSADQIKSELKENGFRLLEFYPVYVFPPVISMFLSLYTRKLANNKHEKIRRIFQKVMIEFQKSFIRSRLFVGRTKQWVVTCRLST